MLQSSSGVFPDSADLFTYTIGGSIVRQSLSSAEGISQNVSKSSQNSIIVPHTGFLESGLQALSIERGRL